MRQRVEHLVAELKKEGVKFPIILELDGSSTHIDLDFIKMCIEKQM